jgi:prephenate dehydratase
MRVAYQGAEGAFSHEACRRFLPNHVPVPLATFSEVITAVQSGQSELGVLPLSNNEAGETGARELIVKAGLQIVEEPVLAVHMHLLGLPSASLEQIRTVVSHPVALRQCSDMLSQRGLNTEETSNTALAAQALRNPNRAVLASETAAELYGLAILQRDVHNRDDNATTFAIVRRGES